VELPSATLGWAFHLFSPEPTLNGRKTTRPLPLRNGSSDYPVVDVFFPLPFSPQRAFVTRRKPSLLFSVPPTGLGPADSPPLFTGETLAREMRSGRILPLDAIPGIQYRGQILLFPSFFSLLTLGLKSGNQTGLARHIPTPFLFPFFLRNLFQPSAPTQEGSLQEDPLALETVSASKLSGRTIK